MNQPVTEEEIATRTQFPRVKPDDLDAQIKEVRYHYVDLTTKCTIIMQNGFTVHGEGACAVPGNYRKDLGERLAFNDAKNKMWALLGYQLKEKVHLAKQLGTAKTIGTEAKVFVGTKALWARPMTRGAYNAYRAWTMPENENGDDEGYLVEYPDGHVSWSPKDTFEASYDVMDIKGEGSEGGPTWLDRLEIEQTEVNERLTKLYEFLEGKLFKSLPDDQQNLLRQQADAMAQYLGILVARIQG